MCGISLLVCDRSSYGSTSESCRAAHKQALARRGPDGTAYASVYVGDAVIEVGASLLQLRGGEACSPLRQDEHGNVLAFNGAHVDVARLIFRS